MQTVQLFRLKPNPRGKDRARTSGASAAQLGAEWVDLKNTGSSPVTLSGITLYHLAYSRTSSQAEWKEVVALPGSLQAGKVLRIHSGKTRDLSVLNPEDIAGADFHLFSGEDVYVWNNAEGDTAGLWYVVGKTWVDKASYDANPPEGVVLARLGEKLVPTGVGTRY